jgi:lipopolysaccharide biosynthesis glycosyltransferase
MAQANERALFLSVDRAMFAPALFAAHTARLNARVHSFDIFIAVPENAIEPAWIDWAEVHIGVHVKEVGKLAERVGLARTANPVLPPSACYRYFFDLVVPERAKRLIYLDADVHVLGDVSRLFDLDLGPHAFAACPDGLIMSQARQSGTWAQRYFAQIGHDASVPYFNTGAMIIDKLRWQNEGISERVMAHLREHLDICVLADQSALNRMFRGAVQPISPVWNFLTAASPRGELLDAVAPAVLHFAGPEKPWKPLTWKQDEKEPQAYRNFFRHSPWPRFCSIWRGTPTWKKMRKYIKRRFLGHMPRLSRQHATTVAWYADHIRTFNFADKSQGLVAFDDEHVLRAT